MSRHGIIGADLHGEGRGEGAFSSIQDRVEEVQRSETQTLVGVQVHPPTLDEGPRRQNGNQQASSRGRRKVNRSLGFITTNAQSLRNKMEEFKTLVKVKDPKIISITESWGKEWISDGIFLLPGCSLQTTKYTRLTNVNITYHS